MNYEEMSDQQINEQVAKLEHPKHTVRLLPHNSAVTMIKENGFTSGSLCYYDPCNDPSDAWPIIVENGIDIQWPDKDCPTGTAAIRKIWCEDIYIDFTDKSKALRSCMIVYLMAQN